MKRGMLVSIVVGLALTGITKGRATDLVSKEEAIRIVKEEILKDDTLEVWLYITPEPIKRDSIIKSAGDDYVYTNPYSECWFFFIDDMPGAFFVHPCRYLFFYELVGDRQHYLIVYEEWFPTIWDSMEQIIPPQGIGGNSQNSSSFRLEIYPSFQKITIFYNLPEESSISIGIWDVTGRLVRYLTRERRTPGTYSLLWDGRDDEERLLPPGVYFIRFKAADYSKTQKVILFR